MKNIFTKNYNDLKERLNISKNTHLSDGIYLLLISTITIIFDLKIEDLSVLYLLPITFIYLGLKYLIIANNYKELNTINWTILLITSFIPLLLVLYLLFNPLKTKEEFIIFLGIAIIYNSLVSLLLYKKIHIIELIRFILSIILGTLIIIFNEFIIDNYLYLLILFIIISLSNIIEYFFIKKNN